jgi:hypothetical protein
MLLTPHYNGYLIPPTGFSISIPVKVFWNGLTYITNLNRFDYQISASNSYYLASWGNDSNSGTSLNNAFATPNALIAAANATGLGANFFVDGTGNYVYDRNKAWTTSPTVPVNVIGINGTPTFSARQDLTFSAFSGAAYQATRSSILWEFDSAILNANGDASRLAKVADAATVVSTAGSFFTDNVTLYVRTADSRNLATSSLGMLNMLKINPPTLTTNNNIYVENINFEGFQTAAFSISNSSSNDTITAYFRSCSFKYANDSGSSELTGNGLAILGAAKTILDNCVTASNFLDGNNYHFKNTVIPHAVEFNCISRGNGYSTITPEANNASTIHDGGRIIRVNGQYYDSQGRNLHDVNANAATEVQSWNIGTNSHSSRALTSTGGANYASGDGTGGHTKMWLTNPLSSGSVEDYIINSGDTLLYNLGSQASGWTGVNNGGTLSTFTQGY